jgi:hypothetical protein
MTERDPLPADGLTPAQAEAVRRLLAGARHDEGIPGDVAARLDAMIADLAAERVEGTPAASDEAPREAVVIALHRRRWPQVLVAAAAVTIVGFGIAQMVGNSADDAGGAGTADRDFAPEVATSQELGDDKVDPGDDSPQSAPLSPQNGAADQLSGTSLRLDNESLTRLGIKGLRQISSGTLDRDLEELARATGAAAGAPEAYDGRNVAARCGPYYTVSGGESFAASYRRHLALVLFHPELDGVRLVEIYDCDGTTPRRTIRTVTLQTGE